MEMMSSPPGMSVITLICSMGRLLKVSLLSLMLAAAFCLSLQAQGKLYTRKAKLEDFPTRTVKVVVGGNSFLDLSFREEITTRWRISPYEFCTPAEYESLKSDNSLYFLNIVSDEGVAFLLLTKGGREDETDNLKKPFEVIRIPIASIDDPNGKELMFMGAFVDVLQAFVEDAMVSDKAAYSGLKWYNSRKFSGKHIYLNDPDLVDEKYFSGETGALVGICIAPTLVSFGSKCYKMVISADTHELYYFRASKYSGPRDREFTEREIKKINKRNGVSAKPLYQET